MLLGQGERKELGRAVSRSRCVMEHSAPGDRHMANELENMRVAILATDGFEQVELTEPMKALKRAGARV